MGEFRFLHLTQGPLSGSKQVWHRSFGFGAIDPRLPGAFDAPPDTTSGQVEVTTSSPTFHRATLLSSVSRGLTASLVGALLIWLAAFTEFADYQEVKVEHQLLNPSDLDKDIEVPLFTFLAAILGPEEYLCLHWKLCPIYASMAAAPSTSLSSGVPLQEFRRDLPPGWAPGLADYSLNQYLQKLKLWYRIYDGPDEAVGPLVAGRLQGQAQKLALNLRLIRPDGNFDVGDNALVRLSVDQVIDPMDGVTILQHAIPSGVQALAHQLREAFGMSDQEHTTSALNAFFEFRRGKLSLQEYASEWDLRYDEAQTRAGLDINPVAKTYLWFRNSGLPNKFIEDVKLQIQGDMSRFAEAKRLALRLSQRGENSTFSTDLYGTVDEPYEDYHTTDDWSSWHEPWQETWYADEWADDDLYTWYDAEEGYYDEEWSTYHGESPSSEWYSPEEYDMSAQDAYDPPPQAASSTDQNEDAYYGKGGKGGSGGCHVCGSKWHHAAQCPVKTGSRELGKSKGKGKFKSRPPWRSKGKGKWSSGKGYKGKKGKGKSKGYSHDSQGYMVDRDAMAYFRQQPGNGLRVEDPSTPPRPVNPSSSLKMTPPDNTELLAWRGSAPLEEAGHDPSSGETYAEVPPPKNLTFATYVNNTSVEHSCYHHSVKGKKRRSLLIDPGAAAGLVGSETLRDLIESCYPEDGKNMVTWSESTATITGISGCPDKALGRVHLRLPFRGLKAVYEADVIGNEGSLCPALCGNPALCAMKASLHSSWFDNQDGLLVTWDTQSQNTPVMYAFRVLLTDSGHYLLPLDEDTSLKSQDLQICHFIKELSEVAHRQWPDHAYTFWQSAVRTAIPEQKRSCLERTYHSSPFEVEPKDPRATAQQTSCSTTPEAEIKNHDSLTSCSTTVEEKIKDQGIDTSCSASPEDEIHDHSVNTSCSTSPEAEIHDHSMNTSCSTIPEETFNDHGKDTSCSTTTDVFLADALIDLPLYTGDLLPNYLTPEEQKKLTKDYKAMPEEFYTHTNRRMVTPSSFPKWFSEAKKRKTKWHVWEWCSGSSRLSLTCCLAGLIVGFPVDFRYGWDIGNPEHQKMLDMALSTFEPEILMASPRCKFWSISASRRDRHLLLQDREAERPALIYMQQTMSYQVSSGRAYVLEQPWTSAMWSESVMVRNQDFPCWRKPRLTDQCSFGAVDEKRIPVKKSTGLESNIKLKMAIRRCNGHHGQAHAALQGQHNGVNRTAMAAVYPSGFCRALLQDFLKHIQPKGLLRSRHHDAWQTLRTYYKCERCGFGRAATADMQHSFIPGECRYGRIPKTSESSPSTTPSPWTEFQKAARNHKGLKEVTLTVPVGFKMSPEEVVYLKHLLCTLIEQSMVFFEEADGKDYQYWIDDPILLSIIRTCLKKVMYIHGVHIALHPFVKPFPEPKLSASAAPLRLIFRGEFKNWTMHDLEDLRELSPAQQRAPVEEENWMITMFGAPEAPQTGKAPKTPKTTSKTSAPSTSAPMTPAPATPGVGAAPGTPAPHAVQDPPHASQDPEQAGGESVHERKDDQALPDAPYEDISMELPHARTLKPLYSMKRVLQRLPDTVKTAPATAKRLLLGLHEKLWHATARDFASLLLKAGMPPEVIEMSAEAVASCGICRRYSRLPARPRTKVSLAAHFGDEVEMDIFFLWDKAFCLMVDVATRYKVAFLTPSRDAEDLLPGIYANWVRFFGPMRVLTSDQEPALMSSAVAIECERLGITRNPKGTTAGEAGKQHTGTGLIERHVELIKLTMRKMKAECERQGLKSEDNDISIEAAMSHNLCLTYGGYSPAMAVFWSPSTLSLRVRV